MVAGRFLLLCASKIISVFLRGSSKVPRSSPIDVAIVSSPTGPPANFCTIHGVFVLVKRGCVCYTVSTCPLFREFLVQLLIIMGSVIHS